MNPSVELKITLTQDELKTLKNLASAWSKKPGHYYSPEVAKQSALLEKLYKATKETK